MSLPMRLLAPAKINLHLRVGKRRDDGFHPLLTWMCTVGLFDILTLEAMAPYPGLAAAAPRGPNTGAQSPPAARTAGEPVGVPVDLRFDCDLPGLPRDEDNLVVRIAKAFAAEVFAPPPSGGGRSSEAGALGSGARGAGGGGAPGSAGDAPGEALGMCAASRFDPVGFVTNGTAREAGAAREAERPVGEGNEITSPSDRKHSQDHKAGAPAPPGAFARAGMMPSLGIALDKRIPVGAGLGGGSSDAAATLVGLNRLWQAGRAADQLSGFAARFGSDVPFFVAAAHGAPSAACTGRGEIVRAAPRPAPKWALLVLPPFPLATRDVYARFDGAGLGSDGAVAQAPDWRGWAALPARELLPRLVNDLEPAALALSPRLGELRRRFEDEVGRPVRMSGSGSSLFTLFDAAEERDARACERMLDGMDGVRVRLVELAPRSDEALTAATTPPCGGSEMGE